MSGLFGGVSIAPESTYGTDPVTGYTYVHANPGSTLGLRRSIIRANRQGVAVVAAREQAPAFIDGEIPMGLCITETVVSEVLGLFGNIATSAFTFDLGAAPDSNSASIRVNHGDPGVSGTDIEYVYTGCKPQGLRFDLPSTGPGTMTVQLVGQDMARVVAPGAVTQPSETLLLLPSDYATCSVGGTAIGHKGITVNLAYPHSGAERAVCGAASIRQPLPTGPKTITGTINVELDSVTGYDGAAIIDLYLAGTDLGVIIIETPLFIMSGCVMVGDPPSLNTGVQDFAINFEADTFEMGLI